MKTILITLATLLLNLNVSAGFDNTVCISADGGTRIQSFLPRLTQGVTFQMRNSNKSYRLRHDEVVISYENEKIISDEGEVQGCNADQNSTNAILVGYLNIKQTTFTKVTISKRDGSSFDENTKNLQEDGAVSAYMICENSFIAREICL